MYGITGEGLMIAPVVYEGQRQREVYFPTRCGTILTVRWVAVTATSLGVLYLRIRKVSVDCSTGLLMFYRKSQNPQDQLP